MFVIDPKCSQFTPCGSLCWCEYCNESYPSCNVHTIESTFLCVCVCTRMWFICGGCVANYILIIKCTFPCMCACVCACVQAYVCVLFIYGGYVGNYILISVTKNCNSECSMKLFLDLFYLACINPLISLPTPTPFLNSPFFFLACFHIFRSFYLYIPWAVLWWTLPAAQVVFCYRCRLLWFL